MLKRGTPGEGWQGGTDSFSYTSVQTGTKGGFSAWLAGDVYWALAHEHTERQPGTKPCLDWLTDGMVRCARCRGPKLPTWVGWVPLYREQDHAPVLVVIHQNAQDLVRDLKYPDHVIVGRVADKSGVFVRKSDSAVSFKTENATRKQAVDITGNLIAMWRIPELEAWLHKCDKIQRKLEADEQHATRMRLSVPPPTTDTERLAIDAEKKAPANWRELVRGVGLGGEEGEAPPVFNGKRRKPS
jgi:hypothetical protein